jgi:23S rRNA (cytidine1920-2'-O)/16S rRNA (cytidine1409-2'-O)-methyltransferase
MWLRRQLDADRVTTADLAAGCCCRRLKRFAMSAVTSTIPTPVAMCQRLLWSLVHSRDAMDGDIHRLHPSRCHNSPLHSTLCAAWLYIGARNAFQQAWTRLCYQLPPMGASPCPMHVAPSRRATLECQGEPVRKTEDMSQKPETPPARRPSRPARERLDVLLVERGLAPSRERARALIMAGEVRVNGHTVDKPGTAVPRDAACELAGPPAELRYVSRGGLKLERALDAFMLDPAGCVCADVGASTGGFTDVLLRRGAVRVYAIDVGRGQLAWSLQSDPRVVVMDRTNIRTLASLPEPVDCATVDVSFISLRLVLPQVAALLRPGGWIVALIKPQFEAGREEASRGAGVITDPAVHRRVLRTLLRNLASAAEAGAGPWLQARGLTPSPITGRDGNREYLLWLSRMEAGAPVPSEQAVGDEEIDAAVRAAFAGPGTVADGCPR